MIQIRLRGIEPDRRGQGTDSEGRAWATFSRVGAAVPCDLCGEWIEYGWFRVPSPPGALVAVSALQVCARHVWAYHAGTRANGSEVRMADLHSMMGYTPEQLAAMREELERQAGEDD
jgi:hypothetical protein